MQDGERKFYTRREPELTRPPILVHEFDPRLCCVHEFKDVKVVREDGQRIVEGLPTPDGVEIVQLQQCSKCLAAATVTKAGKLVEYDRTGELMTFHKVDKRPVA
jgi:hypothetical protein